MASVKKSQLFGIKVRCDTFDINETGRDKLMAGKSGDDIVVPSSDWARLQMDGGLLRSLDTSMLPHLKNPDQTQAQIGILEPGKQGLLNFEMTAIPADAPNAQNAQAAINDIMR